MVVQAGAPLDRPDKYEVVSDGDITVFLDRALARDTSTETGNFVLTVSRSKALCWERLVGRLERKRG